MDRNQSPPCGTHDWQPIDTLFVDTAGDTYPGGLFRLERCRHCWLERTVRVEDLTAESAFSSHGILTTLVGLGCFLVPLLAWVLTE